MFEDLRESFLNGATWDIGGRKRRLERLASFLDSESAALAEDLAQDLGKSHEEAWLTEIGFVRHEIAHALKNIGKWTREKRVRTPLFLWPGRSRVRPQPRGLTLIISPWNYPLQLSLSPLVASIAAGNVAVVKPSEFAPATSRRLAAHLPDVLGRDAVTVAEGGVPETTEILKEQFDFIFFTGSAGTAKAIARAAAEHLTPTVLELGGKSPCVVARCRHIETAARRIAFAKFVNAGQTCVAPDYILAENKSRDELVSALKQAVSQMYGNGAPQPMARIVNDRHFRRLEALLGHGETIVFGGERQPDKRFFAPTILEISEDHPIMEEEIFGPILPIIAIEDGMPAEKIVAKLARRPSPLAAYLFSDCEDDARAFRRLRCGGFARNDALMQLSNIDLPFGGVGCSGHGLSHGYAGFEAFSHMRSEFSQSASIDFPMKYPPYEPRAMKWLRKLMK